MRILWFVKSLFTQLSSQTRNSQSCNHRQSSRLRDRQGVQCTLLTRCSMYIPYKVFSVHSLQGVPCTLLTRCSMYTPFKVFHVHSFQGVTCTLLTRCYMYTRYFTVRSLFCWFILLAAFIGGFTLRLRAMTNHVTKESKFGAQNVHSMAEEK